MHRPLNCSTLSVQSLFRSLNCLKASGYGFQISASRLEERQNFSTLAGSGDLGYGKETFIKSMQVQIINALRLGERNRASTLLTDLGSESNSLSANDFNYILSYCARTPDPLFVMETWKVMVHKDIEMSGKSYFLTIRALCKGGYLKEAFDLMRILGGSFDFHPVLPMYNNCLGACAQSHDIHYADKCLDLMEQDMVGKNEVTYTALLKLAVLQQNLLAVHEIWIEFIKFYSLSIIPLRKFIWSFTKLGDLESAFVTLQHLVALAFHEGIFLSKTIEGKICSSRLDIPIPSNNQLSLKRLGFKNSNFYSSVSEKNKKLDIGTCDYKCSATCGMEQKVVNLGISFPKKHFSVPVMKILRWSFSDVVHGCALAQNFGLAEQLILQMQHLGLEPTPATYDGFIRAAASRGFQECMEVLRVMQEKKVKPYDSTFATISVSCSKALELDLAKAFLDQISESTGSYPYNAFFEACDTLGQPERAIKLLAKMKLIKINPDIRTYELLFSLFGNVNAPYEEGNMLSQVDAAKRISAIEMDMANNGIQHSLLSMKNVLKAFGTEGMVRELIQYLHTAENQSARYNAYLGTPIYNTVLHSLIEAKEIAIAKEIFKTMKLRGCPLDAATYNIMIDCCSIINNFKSACALVSLMIRDGFYPQTVTYTALIKILLGREDFDEALNLLNQGYLEGIPSDVLLFNTILQTAKEKERLDVVELIVQKMFQENIQPDPSTCSYVFLAYTDQGFFRTAMEALQVLSMRMLSSEDAILAEKRMEFEGLILSDDVEAESQILELFGNSDESAAFAILTLRWCAIVGCSISWLPSQSHWTKSVMSRNVSSEALS